MEARGQPLPATLPRTRKSVLVPIKWDVSWAPELVLDILEKREISCPCWDWNPMLSSPYIAYSLYGLCQKLKSRICISELNCDNDLWKLFYVMFKTWVLWGVKVAWVWNALSSRSVHTLAFGTHRVESVKVEEQRTNGHFAELSLSWTIECSYWEFKRTQKW